MSTYLKYIFYPQQQICKFPFWEKRSVLSSKVAEIWNSKERQPWKSDIFFHAEVTLTPQPNRFLYHPKSDLLVCTNTRDISSGLGWKKTAHSHWSLSLKTGYRFINQKPTFSIWKSIKTGCTYFEISQMLKPWKGDSITSHGVPVTHCEQATILVLKLKVVQLRKFPFFPNVFFSFLLFLSIAWISSESDFLRGVLFPRVCFAPHWVFQRICILNKMHSIDRIYQHDMHSEDSNHIYASWQPT